MSLHMQKSDRSGSPAAEPGLETAPATPSASSLDGVRSARAPWQRPRLERFGDVRQRTMGGSLGINESSNPMIAHP
jgi:hypothetical protein